MVMKISVITVCYNAGAKLAETINGILAQTCDSFEIVVKDGGSSDGSVEEIEKLGDNRVRIIRSKDKGIYDAMNEAVGYATGEYVIFMNAGDRFYDNDVLKKVASANLPASNTIAYGDTYFIKSRSLSKAPKKITGSVCYRNIPCHQAIFYSKDTLLERGFDISYKIRADFEHFAYSFFKAERDFVCLGFPICLYEGGGYSESKENRKRDRFEYKRAVRTNIPAGKRFVYRATLVLTLHRLRKALADNPKTAAFYQKLKGKIYG